MKRLTLLVIVGILFFPNLIQSQCAPIIQGYTNIGELNGHNYYLSIDDAKPTDAQAAAEALGGYLAVIDDAGEDDFIFQNINELTYIGLNDADAEGTFEWFNGDPVGYINIDPCGFCTSNSENQDYVVKEPWGGGGWSFSNFWNARKFLVEIPCGTVPTGLQVNCDLNIDPNDLQVESSDPTGNIVNWTPPTATTDCPGGIVSIEQVSGQPSGSFFTAWIDNYIVYIIIDACGNEKECYYELEVDGLYGGINCPNDIIVDATSADGAIVNFDLPTISPTTCIPGTPNQVSGAPSGSVFPIGTTEIQFVSFFGGSTTYCQNGISCSFTITVNPTNTGGGCPGDFSGFTTLGEFGDSKYYISNDVSRPVDAQAVAESNGGYLATISSQAENDFIQQNISDLVYIGLNDYDSEGDLEWFNGEAFTFDNVNPCGFCNENSADMDFVVMAPWNGEWSFSNFYNNRKYIMEVPCGGNSGGGDCSFITEVGVNPSQIEIVKTNDGYQAQVLTSSFDIDYREVDLNDNGIVTTINDVAPDMPNSSTYLKGENFYVTYPMSNGISFDLSGYGVDGTPMWNSTFDINTIDPNADQLVNVKLVDVGDGIMGFGAYHFGNAGTWRRFVIKIDYNGNEIFQNNMNVVTEYPTYQGIQAAVDGGLYYTRRSDSATGYFGRITGNGNFAWENVVIGDLVTNKMFLVGETPDEQSVYLSVANNNSYKAFVRKYNVATGDELWEVDLNNVFSPDRFGSTFGYRGAAVTPDGGIIAAITYSELGTSYINGTEYGRLDANGNLMWWHDAPVGFFGMLANAALADGSLFFTKNNAGNSTTIIRMNDDGTFDPACANGNSPDLDLANLSFVSSMLEVGQTYNAEFQIHNNNLATATQYEVAVFMQEYDFSNPNPTEHFVSSHSYSNTEFGFFETSVDFIPPNIPEGQYKLKLVIDYGDNVSESDENNNTIEAIGIFTLENNGGGDLSDLTISNLTNFPNSTETGEVVSFNFDLNNIGTITASGNYNINMYISTDATWSADDLLVGEVPTGDTPVGTIANVPGAIAVPNLSDGNYFLIIVADDFDDIEESNENNNTLMAAFEITSGGGGCPTSLPDYISIGEFNGSAYFLSSDVAQPVDAQIAAEALGGNLATIDSQAENDFIFPNLGELVYIGLNDYQTEGTLEWSSGEPVNFTNFDICGFCNGNADNMDFVVMHSWNGGWSWSNFFNSRKYIVEIPCSPTLTNPNVNNSLIAQVPNQLDFEELMIEKLHPNPAMDFIYTTIQSSIEQEVEVQIFDARGALMKNETLLLAKGKNVTRISISDLPGGFYSVYIPTAQGKNSTKRFVKVRN